MVKAPGSGANNIILDSQRIRLYRNNDQWITKLGPLGPRVEQDGTPLWTDRHDWKQYHYHYIGDGKNKEESLFIECQPHAFLSDQTFTQGPGHPLPREQIHQHTRPKTFCRKLRMRAVKTTNKQECFPVGCVPSAAVAVGKYLTGSVCPGDVYSNMHWVGGCLPQCMLGCTPW